MICEIIAQIKTMHFFSTLEGHFMPPPIQHMPHVTL